MPEMRSKIVSWLIVPKKQSSKSENKQEIGGIRPNETKVIEISPKKGVMLTENQGHDQVEVEGENEKSL